MVESTPLTLRPPPVARVLLPLTTLPVKVNDLAWRDTPPPSDWATFPRKLDPEISTGCPVALMARPPPEAAELAPDGAPDPNTEFLTTTAGPVGSGWIRTAPPNTGAVLARKVSPSSVGEERPVMSIAPPDSLAGARPFLKVRLRIVVAPALLPASDRAVLWPSNVAPVPPPCRVIDWFAGRVKDPVQIWPWSRVTGGLAVVAPVRAACSPVQLTACAGAAVSAKTTSASTGALAR